MRRCQRRRGQTLVWFHNFRTIRADRQSRLHVCLEVGRFGGGARGIEAKNTWIVAPQRMPRPQQDQVERDAAVLVGLYQLVRV